MRNKPGKKSIKKRINIEAVKLRADARGSCLQRRVELKKVEAIFINFFINLE